MLWRGFTLPESAKFGKLNQPDDFPCLIFLFCTRGKTWNGELANTFYRVEFKFTKLYYNHYTMDVERWRVGSLTHMVRYFPLSNSHQPLTWFRAIDLNTKDHLSKLAFTCRLHTSWWILKSLVALPSVVRRYISHDSFAKSCKKDWLIQNLINNYSQSGIELSKLRSVT